MGPYSPCLLDRRDGGRVGSHAGLSIGAALRSRQRHRSQLRRDNRQLDRRREAAGLDEFDAAGVNKAVTRDDGPPGACSTCTTPTLNTLRSWLARTNSRSMA
jgi:hypothetical protein